MMRLENSVVPTGVPLRKLERALKTSTPRELKLLNDRTVVSRNSYPNLMSCRPRFQDSPSMPCQLVSTRSRGLENGDEPRNDRTPNRMVGSPKSRGFVTPVFSFSESLGLPNTFASSGTNPLRWRFQPKRASFTTFVDRELTRLSDTSSVLVGVTVFVRARFVPP